MKLRIKMIENLILLLIIGQVVVFRFFNLHEIMNKIILILITILCFFYIVQGKFNRINVTGETVSILVIVSMLVINGLFYGNNSIFKSNILIMFYPLMNMFYLTYYIKKYQDSFYRKMIQLRYVINIYFIINIIVMFIQLQGDYFLVGVVTQENPMYEDLISGLLGYSMVASVCYFSVFVIIYNIVISYTVKNHFRKKIFIVYIVWLIFIMAYLSMQNDNVQYFAFLPLALIVMMLSRNRLNTVNGVQKVLLIVLVCVLGITMTLGLVPSLFEMLNDSVLYKFTGAIEHMYDGASVTHGSMERLALVVYGLTHANGWGLGKGFAYAGVFTPYTFGFVHFGNANIGAFVCLGGIWFYFAVIYLYLKRLVNMIEYNTHKNQKIFYNVVVGICLVAASTFSIPLTDVSIGLCLMFIMLAFGLNRYLEMHEKEIVL